MSFGSCGVPCATARNDPIPSASISRAAEDGDAHPVPLRDLARPLREKLRRAEIARHHRERARERLPCPDRLRRCASAAARCRRCRWRGSSLARAVAALRLPAARVLRSLYSHEPAISPTVIASISRSVRISAVNTTTSSPRRACMRCRAAIAAARLKRCSRGRSLCPCRRA